LSRLKKYVIIHSFGVKNMLGFYNVSVILTYISLVLAVVGINLAAGGNMNVAVACLMLCGVCDMFDGKIARATKRSEDAKTFGIQIDSLCDLVCFGVLPAVIAMELGVDGVFGTAVLAGYVLCAVIRLGFFNVMEQKRQEMTSENRTLYQGMPVTASSWLVPAYYVSRQLLGSRFVMGFEIWMLIIAALFVIDFRVKKPQQSKILFMAAAVLVVAAIVIIVQK